VMVTWNMDVANGTWGEITEINLDEQEDKFDQLYHCITHHAMSL
jgi:hypothetical protein